MCLHVRSFSLESEMLGVQFNMGFPLRIESNVIDCAPVTGRNLIGQDLEGAAAFLFHFFEPEDDGVSF